MFVRATTRRQEDDGDVALTQECVVCREVTFSVVVVELMEEEKKKKKNRTTYFRAGTPLTPPKCHPALYSY